jgi:hypothetical protein
VKPALVWLLVGSWEHSNKNRPFNVWQITQQELIFKASKQMANQVAIGITAAQTFFDETKCPLCTNVRNGHWHI